MYIVSRIEWSVSEFACEVGKTEDEDGRRPANSLLSMKINKVRAIWGLDSTYNPEGRRLMTASEMPRTI
jgi:hypothetical protein